MRSRIIFASLIMVFLLSTAAFGEIRDVNDGGNDPVDSGPNCYVSALANSGTNYDEDTCSGWLFVYTTVNSDVVFSWWVSNDAWCEISVDYGDWAEAVAISRIEASGPPVYHYNWNGEDDDGYLYSAVELYEYGPPPGGDTYKSEAEPGYESNSGTDWLAAYEGIVIEADADAVCEIEEGTNGTAKAEAECHGSASLSYN